MRKSSGIAAASDVVTASEKGRPGWLTRVFGPTSILNGGEGLPWHRSPRLALWLGVISTALGVFVGFLGPSVITLTLGERDNWLPSYYLPGQKSPIADWPVSFLTYFLVALGFAATIIALRAQAGGWRPNTRKLFAGGLVTSFAYILVPPMTSADVIMYAAYGRLTKLGINNFVVSPASYHLGSWDPLLKWMEDPWQNTINVYGPILVGIQWLANYLGGDSIHDVVFWFQLIFWLFFVACGVIVYKMAGDDDLLKSRALLFTVANPAMVWAIVAGAHNEAVGLSFAILGLAFMRKNPFLVGFFIGVGCTAKVTVALYGLGMAWAYRRDIKKFLLAMLGAAIPNVVAYIFLFPDALKAASQNASYVSSSSWVYPVRSFVQPFVEGDTVEMLMSMVAYSAAIFLGWMLSRVMPWRPAPGLPKGENPERDPMTIALRTNAIVGAAYLITSAYTLPWYDLVYFMPMALLGPSKLDFFGLARASMMNLAFVLGRVLPYTKDMQIFANRSRETLATTVAMCLMLGIAMWWNERGVRVGSHVKPQHYRDDDATSPPATPAAAAEH